MGPEAGRLLRGESDYPLCSYHLVLTHLQERKVLHLSPCHRTAQSQIRGCLSDTDELSRTGELPFSIHGCMARWSDGAVGGSDCKRKDSAVTNDLTTTLLGDVRKRVYTRHNNPEEPKILCVGNNPDRQNIYGAALGLYNSRIVKLINKKGQLKSSVIIDELPTIYFKGLDNLIATARSNKVAVCLGFQDFSQLTRDYGDKESKVIQNTVGNVFSGQVVGETAKTLSERFGKVLQQRQSMTINRNDKSTSISTQMDSLIPASKISNLTQGIFVGAVSDNFDERIDQKIFHAEIVVDSVKVSAEMKAYQPIPVIVEFKNEDGSDNLKETIEANYRKVKQEILTLVDSEIQRIKNTPALSHLIPDK